MAARCGFVPPRRRATSRADVASPHMRRRSSSNHRPSGGVIGSAGGSRDLASLSPGAPPSKMAISCEPRTVRGDGFLAVNCRTEFRRVRTANHNFELSLAAYSAIASRISNLQEGAMKSRVKTLVYIQSIHNRYQFASGGGSGGSAVPIRLASLSDHENRIPRVVHALQSRFVSQKHHPARYAETPRSAPARLIVTSAPMSVLSGCWPRCDAPTRSAPPAHPTRRSRCPGPASAR